MAAAGRSASTLLVTRVATRLGIASVADRLGIPGSPAYLYAGLVIVVNFGGISMVQYLERGYHPALVYPLWYVTPSGILFGLWASRHLARRYDRLVETLADRLDDPAALDRPLVSFRFQAGIYVIYAAGGFAFFYLQPAIRETAFAVEGPALFSVKFVVVVLGLNYLAIAELSSVVLGVHGFLPWRLLRAGIEVDFDDRAGGLAPVGGVIQRSTQVYFVGLFLYTLVTFAPLVFESQPGPGPGTFFSGVFLWAWFMGFALFAAPTVWLRREIKRQKAARIERLQAMLREVGGTESSVPDHLPADADIPRYLYLHAAIDRIERTREYPTNAGLVRDLGVSSLPSILTYLTALLVALF